MSWGEYAIGTLVGATAVVTLATLVTRRLQLARACRGLGRLGSSVALVLAVSDVALAYVASLDKGLTQADRRRMWSNAIAEALSDASSVGVFAAAALVAAWWVVGRQARDARDAGPA